MNSYPKRDVLLTVSPIIVLVWIQALSADELVGDKIIASRPGIIVRQSPSDDAPAVDYSFAAPIWKILETKVDWLRVRDGWLRKAEVIPIDQAVEYFSAQIKESPSAYAYAASSRARLNGKGDLDEAAKDAEIALNMDPASCDALFAKASSLREAGQMAEAIECYSRIIKLDPRCKGIYFSYAVALMKKKDVDRVLDVASMALRAWPDDVNFRQMRGSWYLIRGSQRASDENLAGAEQDYSDSIHDWSDVHRRSPTAGSKERCAQAYALRAGLRLHASKFDEAVSDFSRSLELVADDPQIWCRRGCAHGLNNSHQLAIDDFKMAIRLGLKDASAFAAYGQSLLALDQNDEALSNFSKSIVLDDRNPALYELRGRAWMEKAEYKQAIADFGKAIALDPRAAAYYQRRALAWQGMKEYDKAIEDCTSAIKLDPRSAQALATRAVSFLNQHELAKALTDCERKLRLDPTNGIAYQTRGGVMGLKGEWKQAIADLSKAISLNPMDLTSLWNRASAWCALGEHEKAVSDYDEYLRISPQTPAGYRARAESLRALGNSQQAVEDMQTADRIEAQGRRR